MTEQDRTLILALASYLDVVAAEYGASRNSDERLALGQILDGGKVTLHLPGTIKLTIEDYGA